MKKQKIIGIIGGVGPFAGLDLLKKILENTIADRDQEHLPVISVSMPHMIQDRTDFLFRKTNINPAEALAEQLLILEKAGAEVAAIPCNTAHAPEIFDRVAEILHSKKSSIKLLNMIEETAAFLKNTCKQGEKIGLLSTPGTYKAKIYDNILAYAGFKLITPDNRYKNKVNEAIYSPKFGVKALGPNQKARAIFLEAFEYLHTQKAQAVILGCSEIPLAITEKKLMKLPVLDPTLLLARALIRESSPDKLKTSM